MSATELLARLVAAVPGASSEQAFGQVTVDVPAASWAPTARLVRDDPAYDCDFLDFLTGYDDPPRGTALVLRVWSTRGRHHVLLRTHVAAGEVLASLVAVWPGADWHERETFEMFGVRFAGHPNLVPLLQSDGPATPLRKDVALPERERPWPGDAFR